MIRYGSVCSGIEAASAAWHPLGWEPAFFSEIEPFPRAVLAHHYPTVPLHGDFTTIGADQYGAIDLLVGGTPCQSFSIAGLRGGLGDDRGNLALEYLRLADRKRPRWLVWENVPGVLSSNDGRDFGSILGGMAELGYGVAYRVLDAQHFGVPQRRRRVFVVGYLGDWRPPAAVLFERHSLSGHLAPRRAQGKENTASLRASTPAGGGQGTDWEHTIAHTLTARPGSSLNAPDFQTYLPVSWPMEITPTLDASFGAKHGQDNQHINQGAGLFVPAMAFDSQSAEDHCGLNFKNTKTSMPTHGDQFDNADLICFEANMSLQPAQIGGPYPTLMRRTYASILKSSAVRRLTPVECERLQGFPDNFTAIPWRNKAAEYCPDGPRYKALGNSMAVPVMRWIGERVQTVENIK